MNSQPQTREQWETDLREFLRKDVKRPAAQRAVIRRPRRRVTRTPA